MELLYALDYYHWIILGMVLLVLEIFVGGAFLMWLGLSSIVVGLLVLLLPFIGVHPSWEWQLVLFGIGALASLALWRRYVKDAPPVEAPQLNQRGRDHVGKVVVLKTAIEDGEGFISIDDTRWRVTGPALPVGTRVRLVALDDMVFSVEAADN